MENYGTMFLCAAVPTVNRRRFVNQSEYQVYSAHSTQYYQPMRVALNSVRLVNNMAAPSNELPGIGEIVHVKASKPVISCIIHLDSVKKEEAQHFTATRWQKIRLCGEQWSKFRGIDRNLAEAISHLLPLECSDLPANVGLHPTCYRRFIDKKSLDVAAKKVTLNEEHTLLEGHSKVAASATRPSTFLTGGERRESAGHHQPPTPNKLWSWSTFPSRRTISWTVLPAVCIICHKEERFVKVAGKRR